MHPKTSNNPGLIATASVLFLALVTLSFLAGNGYAWDAAAYNAGKTVGANMHSKLNSAGKIKERFANPMTSNGTAMRTMDDSQSFTAQLTAPSSDVFLDLFVAPSATGDLATVTLRQDTNFDGTSDYAYSLSSPVSGVCSNGFISADTGTWNNLHYYVWSADSSGRVTAAPIPSMMSLAGCYCINASCGSSLVWTNIDILLRDLGGGVVSAIQQQRNFTITNVHITATEIKYYGQESTNMGNTTGVYFSGTATPQQYYGAGGGTLPGDAELASQAGDPNSMYSRLNVLSNNIGNQYTTKQCSIKRQVSINSDIIDLPEVSVSRSSFYNKWILQQVQAHGTYITFYPQHGAAYNVILHGFTATGGGFINSSYDVTLSASGNLIGIQGVTLTLTGATATVQNGWSGYGPVATTGPGIVGINNVLKWYDFAGRPTGSFIFTNNASCPSGYTLWTGPTGRKCVKDSGGVSTVDTCGGIDLTDCTMLEETACDHADTGCVYTYRNYNPTGLTPLASCYTRVSPYTGVTWTFCADGSSLTYQQGADSGVLESGTDIWWNIHRTYTCEAHNVYDFTNAQQRAGHIQDTLSDNGSTLTFQDFNPDTGATTNNSISLPPREYVERCENSCLVRVPVQDTQASLTGTTADYRDSVNTHKEILRACENGVCPVNAGEVLIQDCQCTNYFNQAATTLQLVHDAGRDMICSGSPP